VPSRPTLGIVLGGGGVRGLAHVGVLNALARAGVAPDVIVGVSMGALVGATYAAREDWREALETVGRERLPSFAEAEEEGLALARMRSLVRSARRLAPTVWTWGRQGYEEYGRSTLRALLGDVAAFEDLRVPLAVTSTDLLAGERIVITEGDLVSAVLASGAIPGLARPVVRDGRTLIDGGFVDPAPVDVARDLGADVVIAVHVGQHAGPLETDTWAMTLLRGLEIGQRRFADERLAHADLVLRPDFGERVNVLNVSAVTDVVRCGNVCARANLDALRALLGR
jgi:NTE family protein